MEIVLYREVDKIASGFRSHCPMLRMAAHGDTPEAADRNLEQGVRLFLAPFERAGTLRSEVRALGLGEVDRLDDAQIVFEQIVFE